MIRLQRNIVYLYLEKVVFKFRTSYSKSFSILGEVPVTTKIAFKTVFMRSDECASALRPAFAEFTDQGLPKERASAQLSNPTGLKYLGITEANSRFHEFTTSVAPIDRQLNFQLTGCLLNNAQNQNFQRFFFVRRIQI